MVVFISLVMSFASMSDRVGCTTSKHFLLFTYIPFGGIVVMRNGKDKLTVCNF